MNQQICSYWGVRDSLAIDDDVILEGEAAVIPKPLCMWYVEKLHDGHQKYVLRAQCTGQGYISTSRTGSLPAKYASSLIQ